MELDTDADRMGKLFLNVIFWAFNTCIRKRGGGEEEKNQEWM